MANNREQRHEGSKFEIFQIKVLYGLWLLEKCQAKFLYQFVNCILLIVSRIFLSNSKWVTFKNYLINHRTELTENSKSPLQDLNLGLATLTFELCLGAYLLPFALPASGLIAILTDNLTIGFISSIIIMIGILSFRPNLDTGNTTGNHIKYFYRINIYEKGSKSKYIRIALLFIFGAILALAIGIGLSFLLMINFA